jgi:small-conductance mechanosensitive channel
LFWGVVFAAATTVLAAAIRKAARRVEPHLTDLTGLRFATALAQLMAYLVGGILYAHLVPELRAVGTALLAGVSVVSVVVGLAAQSTLANLVAGLSLVMYRPIRVGDRIQVNSPKGPVTASVTNVSLGYTVLRDTDEQEVIIPNSVMVTSVVIRLERAELGSDPGAPGQGRHP